MDIKDPKRRTHFGFQEIEKTEKTKKVKEVFDNVSDSYDLMNDLMSFGIHRIWKRIAIEMASIRSDSLILIIYADDHLLASTICLLNQL